MPIDASIALGIKPMQVKPQGEYLNELYARQNAEQSNQLNQMKMDEYRRGLADTESWKQSMGGIDANTSAGQQQIYNALVRKGDIKGATDFAEKVQTTKNLGFIGDKTQGEVSKQKVDLIDAKLKQSKDYLSSVTTPEQYLAWHEANHKDPILGPELAARGVTQDTSRAEIQAALAKPGGFQELLQKSALGLAKFTELNKPNIQTQNLGNRSVVTAYSGLGGEGTQLSSTAIGQSPDSAASNARIASEGKLNRDNAKDVAKLRNSGDLTPEQNDALYGVNGAVTMGKLDPYKVNSRNSHILANAYLINPNTDMNKLASDAAMMRNAPTMNRAYTTEQLPTIISNVVDAGKKVNYSDAKFFGKVQEFINGQSNDPNFINYMTQRNDALLTITSIMRGNGATDQAHRAEIEAAPSTMSPKAFDAWAAGQMKALEPRLKQAGKLTRTPPVPAANTSTPTTGANPHANKTDAEIKAELGL